MPRPKSPYKRVRRAFDRAALKRICEMHELDFIDAYRMDEVLVDQPGPDDFYLFRDNGADILAVAHLDTVVAHKQRTCNFLDTKAGPVVHSGALDDRLGAYTILELLPALGVNVDLLLTVGEEQGMSTASFFTPPKEYNWMIEFDRGGTDVVMYQYHDKETEDLVRASGARVGRGSFSDIAYLDHLEVKGFNWGVGYEDYHSVRGYAYLEDYWMMVGQFLKFHAANAEIYLPHENRFPTARRWSGGWWGDDDEWFVRLREEEKAYGMGDPADPVGVRGQDWVDDDDLVSDDWNIVNARLLDGRTGWPYEMER